MSSKLLALPSELKIKIVTLLVPGIDRPCDFPVHCRTLANDVESIVYSLPNLTSFSRACKETRALCGQMVHHAVMFSLDELRDRVVDNAAGRMSLPPIFEARRTW